MQTKEELRDKIWRDKIWSMLAKSFSRFGPATDIWHETAYIQRENLNSLLDAKETDEIWQYAIDHTLREHSGLMRFVVATDVEFKKYETDKHASIGLVYKFEISDEQIRQSVLSAEFMAWEVAHEWLQKAGASFGVLSKLRDNGAIEVLSTFDYKNGVSEAHRP